MKVRIKAVIAADAQILKQLNAGHRLTDLKTIKCKPQMRRFKDN